MTKGKLLAVCCVWLVILGIGAVLWRGYRNEREEPWFHPRAGERVTVALDSFSGYAVFRSKAFEEELAKKEIILKLVDDGADYSQRIRALEKGDVRRLQRRRPKCATTKTCVCSCV